MKRLLYILIIAALSIGTTKAQSLSDRYNENHPLVMVCDWDKPPYEFLNDKGEPAGSNVDIMRAVAENLGIPIKFVMKEWSIATKTFERGDADIIVANVRRYKNKKSPFIGTENTINYYRIRAAMVADSTTRLSLKVLESEGAVFKPGEFASIYLMERDSFDTHRIEFQTPKVALMGLLNGDYKYFIWGEEPLKWKIKELNLQGITLVDAGIPISDHRVFGRDKELITAIDDQYSRLKQRGEVATIQEHWLHPERETVRTSYTGIYIAISILLLAVLLYLLNRLAKKHVVSATRKSRELSEMMLQALHMGNFIIIEYDIHNDRVTNNYGHILPDEGMPLEEFIHRVHPDQRQEFRQRSKALIDGRERHFELDKRWNAGTDEDLRWFNFQGHAIVEFDENGRPAYIVNAIHDVTQEMDEDKAARYLINKYETLVNIPLAAMSFYNKDGFLINLNDNMRALCGMDHSADACRYWETVSIFDIPLFHNIITPNDREDLHLCQHMYYPDLGIDRYIECHISPLFNADGDITNYLVIALDITDRQKQAHLMYQMKREEKKTEELIALRGERLSNMLRDSDRHIVRSDILSQTIKFYRSPRTPEFVYSVEDFTEVLEENDKALFLKVINDTTTREPQSITVHVSQKSKTHAGVILGITLKPILNQLGQIVGHDGIATNITELHDTRLALQQEVKRAEESVRKKSGFMASMTHELRTPLNAIVGFTGVLEALGDTPDRGEYVRIIRNSSDMLQRLINDIIEASSITEGAFSIQPVEVDFAEIFNDICITLEQRVQNPAVEFLKENPYDHFLTTLDVERVQQVLTNFVTNAVKFTKEGHIKVGYCYKRLQDDHEGSEEGLYCYCEDTGAGIPPEKQKIVFERFVKLDEFVQGTGMGLAISKSIVERCGGEIGLTSEGEGKGTTFWFWIPCERRLTSVT